MADYKIELGTHVKTSEIREQINKYNQNGNNAKLKLGIKLDTDDLKRQINQLSLGGKGIDIPLNTTSLEQSLREAKSIITDIKNSLGTLDSKTGMKSLLSSVNQIATALGKAENESDSLVKSLNALSKKDFKINIGLDMGKKNNNMVAYGRTARKQIIPELESQIKELESLLGGQQATMSKLTKYGGKVGFDVFTDFDDFNSDSVIKKMEAMEKYINSLKKLATIDNVKLDGFNEIHKDATELINDIAGIENAVDKAADVPQKLKSLFGGGISSEQLDSIVSDLNEIKAALKSLSEGVSISEVTQSFKEMSVVLKDITDNLTVFRNAFGNLGNGLSGSISSATQGLKNNANILDTFKRSLQNVGMGADEIDVVANRIKNLGVQIETLNQKKSLSGNKEVLAVDISGIDKFGNAVKLTQEYNVATGDLIRQIDKVSTVHQKAGKSADTFAKQQQRAVTDLTNQIDQLNRSAIDQNAPRPIKETTHLDSLKSKYNEIISAIERMGNASNNTFEDERNKVRTLIGEYKSLKSEYKNAENVALEMDGNDFASGLEIAKNKLAEFKTQAQGFSQLIPTIKELDSAIEGVGNVSSLKDFNNQLRVAKSELSKVKTETRSVGEIKFKLADTGFNGFEQEVRRANAAVDALKSSTPELRLALQQLNAAMDAINSADEANDVQKLVSANKDYEIALRQVYSQLKLNQQAENNALKETSFERRKKAPF